MKLVLRLTLLSMFCLGCASSAVTVDENIAISPADKAKMQKSWTTRLYPYKETDIWEMAFLVCEEREYSVLLYDKPNGYIETSWKIQKYSDSPDFIKRIQRYGTSLDGGDIKWDGMRYRLVILILQVKPGETRFQIRAELHARSSSGSGIWRWWKSNGTLEEMFLAHLEKRLGYVPQVP